MSTQSEEQEPGAEQRDESKQRQRILDVAKAIGAVLGVPLALFAVVSSIVDQPLIALAVALIIAILISIRVVYIHWTGLLEVIVAWLALIVVILAGFIIWPKTMTVEGIVCDTASNPVSNKVVVLFDRSGRRYETKTDSEGHYQFTDVPTGNYRVRVCSSEVEGGTKGILVRVMQQNITVPESLLATEFPTPTPTVSPSPTMTPTPTDTPTPTVTPTSIATLVISGTIGESWVYCTSNGGGGTETRAVDPPRPVTQFRIDMKRRATSYGDSLCEVEAYGPDTGNRNLVIGGKADASSAQDDENCAGCFADKAIDGDMTTRWSSDWYDPQWLEITLPDPQMINLIVLKWETAYASEYCVTVTEPVTATPTTLVHISNVQAGNTVPQSLSLVGRYTPEITDDIWILVGAPGENVWPQSPNACEGESTVKTKGRWEVRVGVGGSDDVGRLFEIIVTTADDQASSFLAQTVQTWCQQDNYPGIPRNELPSGLTSWQSIIVRRGGPEVAQPRPDISNVELPGQVILEGINNGDTVPHSLTLAGTYTNDVTDNIWVLVYPPDGRYYPQSTNACKGVSTIQDGGLWEVKTYLGGDSNAGKPFDIIVVLANKEAHACFKAREREGCSTGSFPGFYSIELPPGIDEKASVSVISE
jgi:hypothetical protein